MTELRQEILKTLKDYPDFPKPGILFKDIGPVLRDPKLFKRMVRYFAECADQLNVQHIVGIESRGFIVGVPLAMEMGLPFSMARKKGKLPGQLVQETYALEYGSDTLEFQKDVVKSGERFMIIDDVIATGGTAAAVGRMLTKQNAVVAGYGFVLELGFLNGRDALAKDTPNSKICSVVTL